MVNLVPDFGPPVYIIAAQQSIDQVGTFNTLDALFEHADQLGLDREMKEIDPLRAGWDTPLQPNHFRSGNAPLDAIQAARLQLQNYQTDLVVIQGEDLLRSGYERQERQAFMEIYPNLSLPQAYTQLAQDWCKLHNMSLDDFIMLAHALFENYEQTYFKNLENKKPDEAWFRFLTPLFRGVDCANPVVDYRGQLVLARMDTIEKMKLDKKKCVAIRGLAVAHTSHKGLFGRQEIVTYAHLQRVFKQACKEAKINFVEAFKSHQAYLEVYTCFPIAPLAFLYASGLAQDVPSCLDVIKHYPLTITGGMNLARAPWNNPVLRAIITFYETLLMPHAKLIAGVHGNGGLGEKQGFIILGKNHG